MSRKFPRRILNIGNIHNEINRRWTIYLILSVTIVLIIVAIVSVYYATQNQDKRLTLNSSSSVVSSSSETSSASSSEVTYTAQFNPRVTEHAPVDIGYFEDAVFIGDSLTVGLSNYGIVKRSNVFADIGLNLDVIETKTVVNTSEGRKTVLDALKFKNPQKIYVMLGSNGISWNSPEKLALRYETFLKKIKEQHPIATIYICAIPPVTNQKQLDDSRFGNSKIAEYNTLLYNIAFKNNVYYLDSDKYLMDEYGNLSLEYAESDGMHMKRKGYEKLLDFYSRFTVEG